MARTSPFAAARDLRERRGRIPVLFVAPHGGISRADLLEVPERPRKSNDLHTDALAMELAEAVDGWALINPSLDRNQLDLNRVSAVESDGLWFGERLAGLLGEILEGAPRALVVFVHGWHIMQPKCDIGIGARLRSVAEASATPERLTIGAQRAEAVLAPLVESLRASGVAPTFGEKWPGAHANNMVQLFRRVPRREYVAPLERVAGWVREDRVDAIQLELGSPLRWPGALRTGLVRSLSVALGARSAAERGATPRGEAGAESSLMPIEEGDGPRAMTLQFFDPAAGAQGLAGSLVLGRMTPGEIGSRILLFDGPSRTAIFTGHGVDRGRFAVESFGFHVADGGFRVRFFGNVVDAPSGRRYFGSETAQRDAAMVPLHVDLRFSRRQRGLGWVEGTIDWAGRAHRVACLGMEAPVLGRPVGMGRAGVRVTATFPDDSAAVLATDDEGSVRLSADGREERLGPGKVEPWEPDAPFRGSFGERVLTCDPVSRIQVLRPAAPRKYFRLDFGTARVRLDGQEGVGFYERLGAAHPVPQE